MSDAAKPDWRSRTRLLYGDDGAARIAGATVLVAGLGAVGSIAVEALARSGVGRLLLVDFDVVEPSNINRQLYALRSTLGMAKGEVAAARVRDINPDCEVSFLAARLPGDADGVGEVLSGFPRPDAIIDAIDDIEAKAALIVHGLHASIPVVSSMGAARRLDPARVRAGALAEVSGCPLAKGLRRALRARLGDAADIPVPRLVCVYSAEPPQPQMAAPECGPRAMGSSMCVTGAFGFAAAAAALRLSAASSLPSSEAKGACAPRAAGASRPSWPGPEPR